METIEDKSKEVVKVEEEKVEQVPVNPQDMKGNRTNYLDIAMSTLTIQLVNGYVGTDGVYHETLTLKEMTGHEEDILAGKGPVIPRLNQIIANCTVKFGELTERRDIVEAVRVMTASDRLLSLIAIRRISLGDVYSVKFKCPDPKCREEVVIDIDLASLEIIRGEDPHQRKREDVLASGRRVCWHIMSHEDETWLTEKGKKKEDMLTLAMLVRVDSITVPDGSVVKIDRSTKEGYAKALKILKGLSIKERNEIRSIFKANEGTVDTEILFNCPVCDYEWKGELEPGRHDFFFPSGT